MWLSLWLPIFTCMWLTVALTICIYIAAIANTELEITENVQ